MPMEITDKLRVLVEAEVEKAVKDMEKFDKATGGSEKSAKSLGDALDAVHKKSMIMSSAVGGAGIAALKFAGENEKLKLSLKNMLGSAEEASAVFEEWRRLGSSPGLSVDEVVDAGRAMVNMGHDTDYATKTIRMLGDVAAGTGKSFGAISGTFEHVRAMEKLTARDLANFQQQGIPIVKQLSKELNASEEGVRKLAAEGKIGFKELEQAFKSMAGPGGQFAGMMEELSGTVLEKFNAAASDAKQALASFGEMMLPMASELLEGASGILKGIANMDEGTRRLVIGMGAAAAASGPAIVAVRAVTAAMTAAMANPYMLAIGGTIAAVSVVAGIINKQRHAYEDLQAEIKKTNAEAKSLISAYSGGNDEKVLDEKITRDLIKLYPELSGVIKANVTTVRELEAAEEGANKQRFIGGQQGRIRAFEQYQEGLRDTLQEIDNLEKNRRDKMASGDWLMDVDHLYQQEVNQLISQREQLVRDIYAQRDLINEALASIGKELKLSGAIVDIPVALAVDTSGAEPMAAPGLKKKWQEWYGEITKVDPNLFGGSGAKAAELYLEDFGRALKAGQDAFAALGESFDLAGALRSQQGEIQKALVDLLSINPHDIDDSFSLIDKAIEPLIEKYKSLGLAAKEAGEAQRAAAAQEEYAKAIEGLRKKIDDFGKSESQLAYDAATAAGALSEQAEEVKKLMDELSRTEILADYRRQVDEFGMSQEELARAALEAAGASREELDSFDAMVEELKRLKGELDPAKGAADDLKKAIDGIRDSFISLGANAALGGIEKLGGALGQGADAGKAMGDALAAMSQEMLNALPGLFLQAGLQLIAQGQWALGLGFVAAAGSSALIKGYVGGKIESERAAANAHGNIFDSSGAIPYARGGSFTNQVVSAPTYFRHGGGLGLMGEAGPEAIVPLKRMPSGDLGIASEGGGGARVTVNIFNNSGAEVAQEEKADGEGNVQLDLVIGPLVNSHIASGKADQALGGRFGLRAAGV